MQRDQELVRTLVKGKMINSYNSFVKRELQLCDFRARPIIANAMDVRIACVGTY